MHLMCATGTDILKRQCAECAQTEGKKEPQDECFGNDGQNPRLRSHELRSHLAAARTGPRHPFSYTEGPAHGVVPGLDPLRAGGNGRGSLALGH